MLEDLKTILVVDDDEAILELIQVILSEEPSYRIITASDGQHALALGFTEKPDLILLDCNLPEMTGLEVLSKLRAHLFTSYIPVILFSAQGEVEDRVRGLEAGADDYIIKPFATIELAARVSAALRRSRRDLVADPLTKLPGNLVLREEIARRLQRKQLFSLAYLDLNHFKAYVDHYGFEKASLTIQKLAQLLYNTLIEQGSPNDFLGHIGGDDFLLLLETEYSEKLCIYIIETFDNMALSYYTDEDRERGYILGEDRYGTKRQFPLLTLSIANIKVIPDDFSNSTELSAFAAKCKEVVKKKDGIKYQLYQKN